MRRLAGPFLAVCVVACVQGASAQSGGGLNLPQTVTAGAAFSIPTNGSGSALLYIVGPGQVLKRNVQLGSAVTIPAGVLYNAGRYVAVLSGGANDSGQFEVVPSQQPASISFLAEPSRLPVGEPNGVSGEAYVYDAYHNLIVRPMPVSFDLSNPSSATESRTVTTRNGVAWTQLNSASKQGNGKFVAHVGDVAETRVIDEVPGDPCSLNMSAKPDGSDVLLQTSPVKDCGGNPVPDGTIVSFTETRGDQQSTADVPLKKDVVSVKMPSWPGATISVASGVVAGNQIRWGGK